MRALIVPVLLLGVPVAAQPKAPHFGLPPDIVVTAPYPRDLLFVLSGVSIVTEDELARIVRPTVGETLARLPGVSSTFFGPGAAAPVLRGLQGQRVRVLTDGIGTFDVSATSPDHAVALSPFAAERIEVIRGPEVLLYGANAIGGVVNAYDRRIPRGRPEGGFHLDALAGIASAAREARAGGSLDLALGPRLVAHVDGTFLNARDLRTGGFVFSRPVRAEAEEEGLDPDDHARRGRIPNTAVRAFDVAGGLSWSSGTGASAGLSLARFESRYGIPNRLAFGHDHHGHHDREDHHAHEDIRLDLRQTRLDGRVEVPLGGVFERLRLRGGFADYAHDELEKDGTVGTRFLSDGGELRAELVQRERSGWKGASGLQFLARRLDAQGEEAYIPENHIRQVGLFTLQEFDLGAFKVEAAGRFEHARVRSKVRPFARGFSALSASVGASVPVAPGARAGLSFTHAERAPSAEELLSDGPHLATQAFEVGDPDLGKERSNGLEATLRGRGEGWRAELALFHTRFGRFIALEPTGEEEDELPVFAYRGKKARFTGLELDAEARLAGGGWGELRGGVLLDWVRATLEGGEPAPQIPPLRVLAYLKGERAHLSARVEVERVTRQDRVAQFEGPTDGWTMLNLALAWRPWGDRDRVVLLEAQNLTDVEARRHASLLRDFAPLAGRDVRLSVRLGF
ncbi:MAG: TonB-dependent receptor [Sphingomonadaceae bacterium]|uniref:TonB-dependent receptor n=1 Tax=Thermaurantiacus sp. TaxID=2820283 RepID=UPI00298F2BC5|nr:TonB-dependent receptor [Thermaurantiacus sp.]MCS6987859.1 TonB-dependent receptor [Sphingomonadaceae bacterium]MDW8414921.1 TonB-dependent receptor [Thermaurantiacus sp.]